MTCSKGRDDFCLDWALHYGKVVAVCGADDKLPWPDSKYKLRLLFTSLWPSLILANSQLSGYNRDQGSGLITKSKCQEKVPALLARHRLRSVITAGCSN